MKFYLAIIFGLISLFGLMGITEGYGRHGWERPRPGSWERPPPGRWDYGRYGYGPYGRYGYGPYYGRGGRYGRNGK
uniref:Sulfur globule protein CV3 domain protein n=1 Tax=Acrobeloides nanus TaxID=290746 RepID=A0A914EMP7_9BILA